MLYAVRQAGKEREMAAFRIRKERQGLEPTSIFRTPGFQLTRDAIRRLFASAGCLMSIVVGCSETTQHQRTMNLENGTPTAL